MSEIINERGMCDMEQLAEECHIPSIQYGLKLLIASHRALQRRVEWTRGKQEKPGWYWTRHVDQDGNASEMISHFTEYELKHIFNGNDYEWAFIEPPHEARG